MTALRLHSGNHNPEHDARGIDRQLACWAKHARPPASVLKAPTACFPTPFLRAQVGGPSQQRGTSQHSSTANTEHKVVAQQRQEGRSVPGN